MDTPPPKGFDERDIADGLADSWGLELARLRYVPKGFGSYHWLGETRRGDRYFITVDDLDRKPWIGSDRESTFEGLQAAYDTALMLRERARLRFVVSPIRGSGGSPARRITPRYSLAVFPFVDGRAGDWGHRASRGDRDELLQLLAELHRSTSVVASRAPNRGAELPGRVGLESAVEEVDQPWTGGPFSEPARSMLGAHTEIVREWLTSFDDLTASLGTAEPVVTHGEPHPGNLIRFEAGLLLIDWDTVALARPERDLWMVDDGSNGGLARYRDATGRPIDSTAITLYRLTWTLADVAAFIALFRSEHQTNPATEKTWSGLTDSLAGRPPRPYGPVPIPQR